MLLHKFILTPYSVPAIAGVTLPLLPTVEADRVLHLGTELLRSTQKHGQGHAGTLRANKPAQEPGCGGSEGGLQAGIKVLDLCLPGTSTFPGLTPAAGTDKCADSYLLSTTFLFPAETT